MFGSGLGLDIANKSTELSGWDLDLPGLDLLPEPDNIAFSVPQAAGPGLASSDNTKLKNRLAQKRFRQRKKERDQTTEAQLAETTSELRNLRLKQRELEARNNLLEKVAALSRQPSSQGDHGASKQAQTGNRSAAQVDFKEVFLKILEKCGLCRSHGGSALVLTGCDKEEHVPTEEPAIMPMSELAELYTAYVQKMAICLLDISGDSGSSSSLELLQRCSLELTGFFICYWCSNPQHVAIMHSLNMQTGLAFQEQPPEILHEDLLEALQYTDSQQQDILHLRRLFYSKLGQLARQRAALLQKVPGAGSDLVHYRPVTFNHGYQHVADKLVETTEVAEQLCANRTEESRVYLFCGFCLFRCIQTSIQNAVMVVNPYPRCADSNELLELLALRHNEKSVEELMNSADVDDLQHVANWETVIQYAASLDATNVHEHTPFLKTPTL